MMTEAQAKDIAELFNEAQRFRKQASEAMIHADALEDAARKLLETLK